MTDSFQKQLLQVHIMGDVHQLSVESMCVPLPIEGSIISRPENAFNIIVGEDWNRRHSCLALGFTSWTQIHFIPGNSVETHSGDAKSQPPLLQALQRPATTLRHPTYMHSGYTSVGDHEAQRATAALWQGRMKYIMSSLTTSFASSATTV